MKTAKTKSSITSSQTKNQCKTCHNENEKLDPLGVEVKHLNHEKDFGGRKVNQLAYWKEIGKLEGF